VAGLKISELPFVAAPSLDDLIVIVHGNETVHTTFRQLEQFFSPAPNPPQLSTIPSDSEWVSQPLMSATHGTARKFIVSLNNTTATSYEVLVMVENGELIFSRYAIIGSGINHNIDFVIEGSDVVAKIYNNEPYPITAEIRPIS